MVDISKNYNDLIDSGNIEQLSKIKEKMQQLGWNSYMVDNAITLAQKYKEETMSQNTSERKVRQVLLNTDEQNGKSSNQQIKNIRRVILDNRSENESLSNLTKSQ